ncbi:exosortase/archaeosortase family protein [Paludibaculum fermentans]|uniref:exosortase/archaeosortase family protein n=1 Tax=Paludibaculum fermentans TaxID=1473598 RepID=UPI003EBCF00B
MALEEGHSVEGSAFGQSGDGWAAWWSHPGPQRTRIRGYAGYIAVLTVLFLLPITQLLVHAAQSELHSHILLVPFIAAYLLSIQKGQPLAPLSTSFFGAGVAGSLAAAALFAGIGWRSNLSLNDGLALLTLAFVGFLAAGGFLFLGWRWMVANAFPAAFLIFMVPLPDAVVDGLEKASALASADAAAFYFRLTGTPVFRQGMVFELPGIALQVAQECSGIRSSLVLFITSLIASHLFLRSPWRRLVLVAFVIPLGILRNGFRILVIGLLCVHVGPHMINSPIHHKGGPLFFALSLIPFTLVLWWLRHQEQRRILRGGG